MSEHSLSFDVVVVGAGPAGLAAACAAAESGRSVRVVDETRRPGGQIWCGQTHATSAAKPSAQPWLNRFFQSGALFLNQTTVFAAPETGLLLAEHQGAAFQLRWERLILATGARELFLPFPGWTLPGVVGPGGLQNLVKHGWPIADKRVVLAGSGPLLLAAADGLHRHGARILAIIEQTPRSALFRFGRQLARHPSKLLQGARLKLSLAGIPYHWGAWPLRAEGSDRLQQVKLTDGARTWALDCDYLACGFGLVPNTELPLLLGCELADGFVRVDDWQATSVPNIYCAGEPTGIGGAECALAEGQIAGYAATGNTLKAQDLFSTRRSWHSFRRALAEAFALRPELRSLADDATVLCRCEDVTLGQARRYQGWREAKLHTRCGMGACQGRTCGPAAKILLGWGMESVRPPILPARVGSLISEPVPASPEVPTTPRPRTVSPPEPAAAAKSRGWKGQ